MYLHSVLLIRDKTSYGKQNAKRLIKRLAICVASACDFNEEELTSDKNGDCTKCGDLERLTDAVKEKNDEKFKIQNKIY